MDDSTPATSDEKGRKRGVNQAIKNVASAKKQKLENEEKQKSENKQPKKVENPEEVVKAAVVEKNQSLAEAAPLVTKNANDVCSDSLDTSESYRDSDVSDEKPKATEKQPSAAIETSTKKDSSSDEFESGSDSKSSDGETKVPVTGKEPSAEASKDQEPSNAPVANNASENSSPGDSSDEYTDGSEESDDDPSLNTPKKKGTDVEIVYASEIPSEKSDPMTPTTSQAPGSRILFVGNLSFKIKDDDLVKFFKTVGEVVEVRLARGPDGKFKGFGHVEFATPEDALKALLLDGDHLMNRPVNLDVARDRGDSTPNIRENKSHQKYGRSASLTAYVTGFDKSVGENEIRSALKNHFGSCGMTTRISIPPDHNNGGPRGMAYIEFKDSNGFNKALELDGSEVNGWQLIVTVAKPKGGGGRRGGGGRFGRGGGGRGGRGNRN